MATEVPSADDGLPAEVVGEWVRDKHAHLRQYVTICDGPRAKTDRPTFIDPFCSYGRSLIEDSAEFVDGSPLVAWKASAEGKKPFDKVFIADRDENRRRICGERLRKIAAPVEEVPGDAIASLREIVQRVKPEPLHLAFLDPYSLGALNFELIQTLSVLERIDIMIHVSVMDLQRNLLDQVEDADAIEFESFAPHWRDHVEISGPQQQIRVRLLRYWEGLVKGLGFSSRSAQLIKGQHGQRLYWLLLLTRHPLGEEFWNAVCRVAPQLRDFGF